MEKSITERNNKRNTILPRMTGGIFDMDGTLLDSMVIWDRAALDYLEWKGLTPEEGLVEKFLPMSLYQAACYLQKEYGISDSTDQIQQDINGMIAHFYQEEVVPKPGARQLLQAFQEAGIKMCLATATDLELVKPALERTGLAEFFPKIFTCTMVGAGKDEPVIFEKAREYLGTKKQETYVFEDAYFAGKTAYEAGFPIAAVLDRDRERYEKLAEFATVKLTKLEDGLKLIQE